MGLTEWFRALPAGAHIVGIMLLAVAGHFVVRGIQRLGEWLLTPKGSGRELFVRRYPRFATVVTIVVSALTFSIYFGAFGLILTELGISLTTYLASATVIGLAVGFGLQGLVQDIIIGMTLIFSNIMDVGDVVEVSGQVGRVERIGLRFTTIVNFVGQQVNVPNRNIALIGRYRRGYIRAYVDVQVPEGDAPDAVNDLLRGLAESFHRQFNAIILSPPELLGVRESGAWRYQRIKFRLWPGQGPLLETTFRQRVATAMRQRDPGFQDWMVSVTYRAE